MYQLVCILFMTFGFQLLSWRRQRGLTQVALAEKSGVPRPYLSRLEQDKADPSLSLIRRLAGALNLTVGELIEVEPVKKELTNEELDGMARAALQPSNPLAVDSPQVRPLSRLLKERRVALGLYKPRRKTQSGKQSSGKATLRRVRADLGERQWKALMSRVDKHSSYLSPKK